MEAKFAEFTGHWGGPYARENAKQAGSVVRCENNSERRALVCRLTPEEGRYSLTVIALHLALGENDALVIKIKAFKSTVTL